MLKFISTKVSLWLTAFYLFSLGVAPAQAGGLYLGIGLSGSPTISEESLDASKKKLVTEVLGENLVNRFEWLFKRNGGLNVFAGYRLQGVNWYLAGELEANYLIKASEKSLIVEQFNGRLKLGFSEAGAGPYVAVGVNTFDIKNTEKTHAALGVVLKLSESASIFSEARFNVAKDAQNFTTGLLKKLNQEGGLAFKEIRAGFIFTF